MKFLVKMAKPLIKRVLKKEIEKESNKVKLANMANEKLDIPKLEEDEEQKLFESLYDVLGEYILKVVERI